MTKSDAATDPLKLKRFAQDAIWGAAFEMYQAECGGKLWEAPQWVQDQYKERAREKMIAFWQPPQAAADGESKEK